MHCHPAYVAVQNVIVTKLMDGNMNNVPFDNLESLKQLLLMQPHTHTHHILVS